MISTTIVLSVLIMNTWSQEGRITAGADGDKDESSDGWLYP